ncbi:MAG TPA: hypothetical protein VNB22_13825 [Pyrinomonadaceae bacterium]|jgi:hypothetical protein|nr:hypothetical protein [Pyrinomonadaceae bacterium]
MQRIYIIFSIVLAVILITGFQSQTSQSQKSNCRFLEESLKNISEIKVGMTRREVLKIFGEEGGISSRTQNHYVYNKCSFIKVDVKFEPVGNEKDKLSESPDDKLIEISKPYLEYAIND